MQNPDRNPLGAITFELPQPEDRPRSRPVAWTTRGIQEQDFPWVESDSSFQWKSFRKVIATLRSRGSAVFVVIGPFNPFVLSDGSLRRYRSVLGRVEQWLRENDVDYHSAPDLLSDHYADASHPLASGYAMMAKELWGTSSFQRWFKLREGGGE